MSRPAVLFSCFVPQSKHSWGKVKKKLFEIKDLKGHPLNDGESA
jgi:hypothetical protein